MILQGKTREQHSPRTSIQKYSKSGKLNILKGYYIMGMCLSQDCKVDLVFKNYINAINYINRIKEKCHMSF